MLTHLHVMVKHLWCWHIYKGGQGGEVGDEVLPLVAPPPPIPCTATPVAVTNVPQIWAAVEKGSPDNTVCTAMCMTVHRHSVSGVTASFIQRVGEGVLGTATGTAPLWRCTALFSQRHGKWGVGSKWHRRAMSGATAACPVPQRLVKLAVGDRWEGHYHPMSSAMSNYPVPLHKLAQRGNGSISWWAYK
jgi:hypothetical protein